jgi:hypothetical protein
MSNTRNPTAAALLAVIDNYVEAASKPDRHQLWLVEKLRRDLEVTVDLVTGSFPVKIEALQGDTVVFCYPGRVPRDAEDAFLLRWESKVPGTRGFVLQGGMTLAAVIGREAVQERGQAA